VVLNLSSFRTYVSLAPPTLDTDEQLLNELPRNLVQIGLLEAVFLPVGGWYLLRPLLVLVSVVIFTPAALAHMGIGSQLSIFPDRSRLLVRPSIFTLVGSLQVRRPLEHMFLFTQKPGVRIFHCPKH
jgi:hypothetical protein